MCLHFGGVSLPSVILEKIVANEEEGGKRLVGGERRDGLTELGVQTAQGVDHQAGLGDRMTDVVKKIT